MKTLTEKQAEAFYKKHFAGKLARFSSYYKYEFNFKYSDGGKTIYISYGGTADDVYRYDLDDSNYIFKLPETLNEVKEDYHKIWIKDYVNNADFYWDGF